MTADSLCGTELETAAAFVRGLVEQLEPGPAIGVAERMVREREARRAFEQCAVPVGVFGSAGTRLHLANQAWRTELAHVPDTIVDVTRRVVATGEIVRVPELEVVRDGRPAYYASTTYPLRGCLGAARGAIVACADRTDLVMAQKLGVEPTALIWSGTHATSADFENHAWRVYTDKRGDWRAAIHPDERARCGEALDQVTVHSRTQTDARLQRLDGTYRWFRIRFSLSTDPRRWLASAVDIEAPRLLSNERLALLSEAQAARAGADRANRLKDQFLATVSHELRGPVTTMLLWEKILRDDPSEPVRKQALDAIRQSALAQSRMVGDLLDVSRAISGKLFVDLRSVSIDAVLTDAIEAASPAARAKGLALTYVGARPGRIEGDVARLRQIFDNLLANAVKFTQSGGRIELRQRHEGGMAVIEIADTGWGIAPQALDRIFEAFHQVEDVLTGNQSGLGLGLAIARQLVQLHGGSLRAASEGLGRGATLTVTLPLSRRRRVSSPGTALTSSLHGKCVLLIDDDDRVRAALVLLLERVGAVVTAVDSAAHGREAIQRCSPDVILCDIAMPGEDGLSFARALRRSGNRIPAIALTAHALPTDATTALDAGFDLHVAKPVNFERLVASIADLLLPAGGS